MAPSSPSQELCKPRLLRGVIEAARRAYGQAGIPAGAPAVNWVLGESRRREAPVSLSGCLPLPKRLFKQHLLRRSVFWGLTGRLGAGDVCGGGSGQGFILGIHPCVAPSGPPPMVLPLADPQPGFSAPAPVMCQLCYGI